MLTYHRGQAPLIGFEGEKDAKKLAAIAVVAAGYSWDMDEELANALLDDMNFFNNKVKCSKIEGMLPKLMKMMGGSEEYEINSMGNHRTLGERRCPAEKRRERW